MLGIHHDVIFRSQGPPIVVGSDSIRHTAAGPDGAVLSIRARVSINVVRLTPKLRHTAALDMPSFRAARIASSFSPTMTGGRPPTRPRRRAAANPATTRSRVRVADGVSAGPAHRPEHGLPPEMAPLEIAHAPTARSSPRRQFCNWAKLCNRPHESSQFVCQRGKSSTRSQFNAILHGGPGAEALTVGSRPIPQTTPFVVRPPRGDR